MANIFNLRGNLNLASRWKMAFAESVIHLCPDMNPDAADEAADSEVGQLKDVDPVVAASDWVQRHGLAGESLKPHTQPGHPFAA